MKHTSQMLTEKQKKQYKFLLMLPMLVLPFLTCLLWALGMVGSNEAKASATTGGLNMRLPDAQLADNKSWNKLSFYEQADRDSAKYKEEIKNDPFFQQKDSSAAFTSRTGSSFAYNPLPPGYNDSNEYKVNQSLAKLNVALNDNTKKDKYSSSYNTPQQMPTVQSNDVNRLEQMLKAANQTDSDADPETQQLNSMMDKILDIQHPERVSNRIQQESEKNKKQVFPVVSVQKDNYPSLLGTGNKVRTDRASKTQQSENAFFSLSSDTTAQGQFSNSIEAEVQETQTFVSGFSVRLCLSTDIYVNGNLIPQGTFIYGIASQNDERLNIAISSIRYQNSLLPVSLSVYDLDGLEGIHIPGSISRDVAKQSGSEALSNMGLSSFDPSLGAQAANAGIAAAKLLINKKVKQVKLTVKAGYRVLLKDNNQQ